MVSPSKTRIKARDSLCMGSQDVLSPPRKKPSPRSSYPLISLNISSVGRFPWRFGWSALGAHYYRFPNRGNHKVNEWNHSGPLRFVCMDRERKSSESLQSTVNSRSGWGLNPPNENLCCFDVGNSLWIKGESVVVNLFPLNHWSSLSFLIQKNQLRWG